MPRQALPSEYGLAIIELRGRFYPVRVKQEQDGTVHLDSPAHLFWEGEYEWGIPFACGPQPTQGVVSFGTWKLAFDYCQRYHEQFGLLYQVGKLAADVEVYPEHNVWYREALRELGGDCLYVDGGTSSVYGSMFVGGMHCSVFAATVDEAVARLYQKVYEHMHGSKEVGQEKATSA